MTPSTRAEPPQVALTHTPPQNTHESPRANHEITDADDLLIRRSLRTNGQRWGRGARTTVEYTYKSGGFDNAPKVGEAKNADSGAENGSVERPSGAVGWGLVAERGTPGA